MAGHGLLARRPRMRSVIRALWLLLAAHGVPAGASPGDAIVGQWQPVQDTAARITVSAEADLYQGRLSAHAERPERVGVHVLRDLRYVADEKRWIGQVYAMRLDKTMDASVRLEDADTLLIEARTWLGTRRVVWRRMH